MSNGLKIGMEKNNFTFLIILGLLLGVIVVLSYGCAARHQYTTGNPIRTENIVKLIKDKSTESDVIELFGMPTSAGFAGSGMETTEMPRPIINSGDEKIYIYKQCTSTTTARTSGAAFLPGGVLYAGGRSKQEEKCEKLSIMLDKKGIVRAFSYFPDDNINDSNISRLVKGQSTKVDVIELFGAPNILNVSDNDEIYTFRKCVTMGTSRGAFSTAQTQNCKQLTIMLGKNTGIVKTYFSQQD